MKMTQEAEAHLLALCLVLMGESVDKAIADAKVLLIYPTLGE
jgi:hypothetical protein